MKRYFTFASFLLPLIVYFLTLNPDVSYTDNGELAGAAITLGIPHSTGYPLFILVSHLWSYLPISSSPVFELNLLSAIFMALSAMMLFLWGDMLLEKLGFKKIGELNRNLLSISLSLSYSFGSVIWSQATSFEVYSLHLLLINTIIYFIFKGDIYNNRKMILLGALFIGLSFANHLTTILLVPFLMYLHFFKPEGPNFKTENIINTIVPGMLVLIGISLYIYLPIRSSQDPIFNWGDVSRGWDKFIYHVSGKQYQVWMFQGMEEFISGLEKFFTSLKGQSWFAIVVFPPILGIYFTFKRNKRIAISLMLLLLTCILYSANYGIHDIDIYFALAYISIQFFITVLLAHTFRKKSKFIPLVLFIPLVSLIINYQKNDNSNDHLVRDYTNILTENLDENAIIISSQWDIWNAPFWYMQQVENYRTDVIMIEKELMRRTWYPSQLINWYPELEKVKPEIDSFLEELEKFESGKSYDGQFLQSRYENFFKSVIQKFLEERPVYVTIDVLNELPLAFDPFYKVPKGFAFQILNNSEVILPVRPISLGTDRLLNKEFDPENHLEDNLIRNAAANLVNLGRYGMLSGQIDSAKVCFEKALDLDPKNVNAGMGLEAIKNNIQ